MTDIVNRVAFITGGANGIGLGIARSLAREGVRLALVDLDNDALAAARAELSELTEVATTVLDVRDRDAFARSATDMEAALGPVSILVNNAGVAGVVPADKLTYDLWDWGIGINLGGVINGIQTFLPRMIERAAGGHIVNTASGAGLYTGPGNTLYCTAKFAVVGMSEALYPELASRGIGVSVLCPGPVATDIIQRTEALQSGETGELDGEQRDKLRERNGRLANYLAGGTQPDPVGDMVRDAILHDRLYIHTDRTSAEPIMARTQALLDAMPTAG